MPLKRFHMLGKILITGGLGNLGSWMTDYFYKQGYDVYVLTRKALYTLPNIKYTVLEADISNITNLKTVIGQYEFDYCIHLASYNEYFHEEYHQKALMINTLGTRNLLDILKDQNLKKFIYFSTFHVYGATSGNVTEESILTPKNDYASTHLFAEYYVKQFGHNYGMNYTIFRLSNSYGCPKNININKWYLVLNDMTRSAFVNQKITLKTNGQVSRDFIWMGDVCNLFTKIDTMKNQEIYNLSSGHNVKIIEIANMVQEIYEERYNKKIDLDINQNDKTIYHHVTVDNSKLLKDFNIKFHNAFKLEINNIFDLLEQYYDK